MRKEWIILITSLLCTLGAAGETSSAAAPKCPVPTINKSQRLDPKNVPQDTADLQSVIASVQAAIQCYQEYRGNDINALPELVEADFEFKTTTNTPVGAGINLFVFKFNASKTHTSVTDVSVRYTAPKKAKVGSALHLAKSPQFLTDALVSEMQGVAEAVRENGKVSNLNLDRVSVSLQFGITFSDSVSINLPVQIVTVGPNVGHDRSDVQTVKLTFGSMPSDSAISTTQQ